MLYAILAYHVEDEILSWTPEQDAAVVAKVIEVQAPLRASGQFGPAARLDETRKARTLRGPGAGMVLDGPFAETKEQLLGFHLMECATEEEAITAARKLRAVNPTAVYEIRPVKLYVPADGFGAKAATIVPGMNTSSGNSEAMISWLQPPNILHHSQALRPAIALRCRP